MKPMIRITDIKDERILIFNQLNEKQLFHYNEPDLGIFICESPKVIERALQGGYKPLCALTEENIDKETERVINKLGDIDIYTASQEILLSITGFNLTRGLLCAFERKENRNVENLLKDSQVIAVLEDVVNPTNIGAIFRSAAALNIDCIILSNNCCDPLYRRSARVSMGTVFQIPYCFINDWDDNGIEKLRQFGFTSLALSLCDNTISIEDEVLQSKDKLAIILGNEGYGLKKETIDNSDYSVKIPMNETVDSLNVAAASAVAFWQLNSKRRKMNE